MSTNAKSTVKTRKGLLSDYYGSIQCEDSKKGKVKVDKKKHILFLNLPPTWPLNYEIFACDVTRKWSIGVDAILNS